VPIKLTPKQRRLLRFIVQFRNQNGFPPTLQELCEEFSWRSKNAAHDALARLERKGWIQRRNRSARGLTVLREV
jgi:repressor LexA